MYFQNSLVLLYFLYNSMFKLIVLQGTWLVRKYSCLSISIWNLLNHWYGSVFTSELTYLLLQRLSWNAIYFKLNHPPLFINFKLNLPWFPSIITHGNGQWNRITWSLNQIRQSQVYTSTSNYRHEQDTLPSSNMDDLDFMFFFLFFCGGYLITRCY